MSKFSQDVVLGVFSEKKWQGVMNKVSFNSKILFLGHSFPVSGPRATPSLIS